VRRGIAIQSDRPGSIVLAFDRLPKNALAAATSRLALSLKSTVRPARSTAGFVTPASACWTLVGALAKWHEEDQLRGISVPA
jgi:hypothetical protein